MTSLRLPAAVLSIALLAACGERPSSRTPAPEARGAATPHAPAVRAFADSEIPAGPAGASVRRGLALIEHTPDSLPRYATSNLRCASCHLDRGLREGAAPLAGVNARYPRFMERSGAVATIEDRVNHCFTRSLAGQPIPVNGREMRDIVAYLAFVSRDAAPGGRVRGEGMPRMPALVGDSARGSTVYAAGCASCHGADGGGNPVVPALWGRRSYSIGASMARVERAASFIRHNMPFDRPGTLSDQQAFDLATFVNAHPRPDSPGKEGDWPRGDAPADVPYATRGHAAFRPPPLLPRAQRSSSSTSRDVVTGAPVAGSSERLRR